MDSNVMKKRSSTLALGDSTTPASPSYVPPPSETHSMKLDEGLNELQGKVERFEEMRKVAYDSQREQNKKVFEEAMDRKKRLENIKKEQTLSYFAGKGTAMILAVLATFEVISASIAGIRWTVKAVRRAREKKSVNADSPEPELRRLHARHWKPSEV